MKLFLTTILTSMNVLIGCQGLENSGINAEGVSEKKKNKVAIGLGVLGTNPQKPENGACEDDLRLGTSWYYNWKSRTSKCAEGHDLTAEFVPMIWSKAHLDKETGKISDKTRDHANNAGYLLGFNEPDGSGQADMSVDEAIESWPGLYQEEGDRYLLGSPAPKRNGSLPKSNEYQAIKQIIQHDWSNPDLPKPEIVKSKKWLPQFMARAAVQGLKIDFMALHYYYYCEGSGDKKHPYRSAKSKKDLDQWLRKVSDLYQRPIWITEFSCLSASTEANVAFLRDAMEVIEQHNAKEEHATTQVERVAWFSNRKSKFGAYYKNTHLVDYNYSTGEIKLTPVGEEYRTYSQ